ncbi:SDR family oxidoreductase [Anaeromyxobacter sp. Fw109-5]|uniref:SDR family oxidoreductase n=1 Tax=Anaeromyxobacter sp. (strain Fw109-5) TaxID=404589 RepID=UPI000158A52C|nr:NAD(P)H-binding protein [Anaeromyxobacter sp. Fw109-5]ABS25910.1 NAD-dependent epimerase/dehydratase [Anaeromyxobacter sp. Fw109-5]
MHTAFVAGATGYTGREVVRALRAAGIATVAHVRPDSPRLEEWRARFGALGAQVDATPWDAAAMATTLARVRPTMVFALLGTTRRRGREAARRGRSESYASVDHGLTRLLLDAALTSGGRPRFVYLSAAGVREGTPSAYLAARARLERELSGSGLPYTIARPSFVTGPDREERRPLERTAAVAADAVLGIAARLGARRLAARWRSITAAELAAALVRLALDPAAERRVVGADALR